MCQQLIMKILFITVLVTVTFIHGSTGFCGCKNTFNDQLTAFYKLFKTNFNLVLENRSNSQNCPPCGTSCPVDSTSTCPGMGPRPAANTCTKLNFKAMADADPIVSFRITQTDVSSMVAEGDDVILFATRGFHLRHYFNSQKYCGLYDYYKFSNLPLFPDFPRSFYGEYIDVFNGHVYAAGSDIKKFGRVYKRSINGGFGEKWTEVVLSPALGYKKFGGLIKWSKDGEKMVLVVRNIVNGKISTHVYDKQGNQIGTLQSTCGKQHPSQGFIGFDIDGNIIVAGAIGKYAPINTICVYNKDTYHQIKTVQPSFENSKLTHLSSLYVHCDGTMILSSSSRICFMDKSYTIIGRMKSKLYRRIYLGIAVTSDGVLRALINGPQLFIFKLIYNG